MLIMKKIAAYFSSQRGLTLIELLASIIILSIIIISLLSMFLQSARSNGISKKMMDATYLAETQIEEINNINTSLTTPSLDNLNLRLVNAYQMDRSCSTCYGTTQNGHYVFIQLKSVSTDLGKVIVKVYKDDQKTIQEAQMEILLSWKK